MIICVSGKKRSGKDTFFNVISKLPNLTVRRYAFADEVKRMSEQYFGITITEENKSEIRFVLQGVGHMMREEIDLSFWVKRTIAQIEEDQKQFPNLIAVITDARYPNELEFADVTVRIENPNVEFDPHPSEISLDNYTEFDYVIDNSGTLADYELEIERTIKEILWGK